MEDLGGDYFWDSHETITEDDYFLTLFRITGDPSGNPIEGQGSKGPLLLQHGYSSDATSWFVPSDENELAVAI